MCTNLASLESRQMSPKVPGRGLFSPAQYYLHWQCSSRGRGDRVPSNSNFLMDCMQDIASIPPPCTGSVAYYGLTIIIVRHSINFQTRRLPLLRRYPPVSVAVCPYLSPVYELSNIFYPIGSASTHYRIISLGTHGPINRLSHGTWLRIR
jgi:hypothetical protein